MSSSNTVSSSSECLYTNIIKSFLFYLIDFAVLLNSKEISSHLLWRNLVNTFKVREEISCERLDLGFKDSRYEDAGDSLILLFDSSESFPLPDLTLIDIFDHIIVASA